MNVSEKQNEAPPCVAPGDILQGKGGGNWLMEQGVVIPLAAGGSSHPFFLQEPLLGLHKLFFSIRPL